MVGMYLPGYVLPVPWWVYTSLGMYYPVHPGYTLYTLHVPYYTATSRTRLGV